MPNIISSFSGEFEFLSNFSYSPITVDGKKYITVEHAFQAIKTHDPVEKQQIADCATAGRAKRLGRVITLRDDWEEIKEETMEELLILKFNNPELKKKLMGTWPKILLEGNMWHDNTWGDCKCPDCITPGKNILGNLLMKVRSIP